MDLALLIIDCERQCCQLGHYNLLERESRWVVELDIEGTCIGSGRFDFVGTIVANRVRCKAVQFNGDTLTNMF